MKKVSPPPRALNVPNLKFRHIAGQIFVVLILFTTSCQEFEPYLEKQAAEKNDAHYVDITRAEMIAGTIEFPLNTKTSKSSKRIGSGFTVFETKKIKESKSPTGRDGKSLYHIINFEEGGFVIISADDRMAPILAFSNENSMPIMDNIEQPEGLLDWFDIHKRMVEAIRENPNAEVEVGDVTGSISTTSLWNSCDIQRQITPENLSSDPCYPDPGGGCQDQYTQVGPLMNTTWDQVCGYNQLMPTLSCSPQCGRALVGCVAVAMAQIMRYHTHPSNYAYGNMPNNAGNIFNATLMRDAFNAFPSDQQKVTCTGTGIDYDDDGRYANAFTNSFGYSSAIQGSFDAMIVRNNLNLGRPVVLGGGGSNGTWFGHMWVTDGYLRAVYCSGQSLLKLHMNWGWGGVGNGFFNYGNFSVTINGTTRSFNNNKYMVYNIIP